MNKDEVNSETLNYNLLSSLINLNYFIESNLHFKEIFS